jgi:hypothetical protein
MATATSRALCSADGEPLDGLHVRSSESGAGRVTWPELLHVGDVAEAPAIAEAYCAFGDGAPAPPHTGTGSGLRTFVTDH